MKVLLSVFVVTALAAAVSGNGEEQCSDMESRCICNSDQAPLECKAPSDVLFLADCSYCFLDQYSEIKTFIQTFVIQLSRIIGNNSRISVMQFGNSGYRLPLVYAFNQPLIEEDIIAAIKSMKFCGEYALLGKGLNYVVEHFETLGNPYAANTSYAVIITNGKSHPSMAFHDFKASATKLHNHAKIIPIAVSNSKGERDDNVFDVLTNPSSTATNFQSATSSISSFDVSTELFIKITDIKPALSIINERNQENYKCPVEPFNTRNCICESTECCPIVPPNQGPVGPIGDQGEPGKPGDNGPPGPPGKIGPPREKGRNGPKGTMGEPCIPGPEGEKGAKGDKGDKGLIGPNGNAGNSGRPGSKGRKGGTGLKGIKGVKGVQGYKGEHGIAGPNGDYGNKGELGRKGQQIQGPKGDIGYDGPEGPPGTPGADGHDGPNGKRGCQGCKGDTGIAGPQGDPGAPGLDGMEADAGSPGVQGPDGSKGLPDEKGSPGPAGASGPNGVPGINGKQGPHGVQGVRGNVGPQSPPSTIVGPQGLKGYRGPQGNPGLLGPDGTTGPQGPRGVPGPRGLPGDDGVCPDLDGIIREYLKYIINSDPHKSDEICD